MKSKLEHLFEELLAWVGAAGAVFFLAKMVMWFIEQSSSP